MNLIDDTSIEVHFDEISINEYLLSDYDPNKEIDIFNMDIDNYSNIEEISLGQYLSTHPWWLPPLQTPSAEYLLEFNNYSEHYLCNVVWWKVVNPTTYYY